MIVNKMIIFAIVIFGFLSGSAQACSIGGQGTSFIYNNTSKDIMVQNVQGIEGARGNVRLGEQVAPSDPISVKPGKKLSFSQSTSYRFFGTAPHTVGRGRINISRTSGEVCTIQFYAYVEGGDCKCSTTFVEGNCDKIGRSAPDLCELGISVFELPTE